MMLIHCGFSLNLHVEIHMAHVFIVAVLFFKHCFFCVVDPSFPCGDFGSKEV